MARPRRCFCPEIAFDPEVVYFKPQGVPLRALEVVTLSLEEVEAYRLRHMEGLEQKDAAKEMHTSPSTYQRLLYSAYRKIADALMNGKAIRFTKHEPTK